MRGVPQTARPGALLALCLILLAGALASGLIHPGQARADGDPASDVLLGADVFYPYTAASKADEDRLNAATAALRTAKAPVKVALIAAPTDLGVIPSLFNQPQAYANFLDTEISFTGPQTLLVVMPSGYGTSHLSPALTAMVRKLPKPASGTATGLVVAALGVIEKIAATEGHPLPASVTAGSGSGSGASGGQTVSGNPNHGGGSTALIIGLIVVAVLGAGGLVAATLRKRGTPA